MPVAPIRRVVAALVAVILVLPFASLNLVAASSATMLGRVTASDGVAPRAGVVVTLVDEGSGATFSSSPSDERGAFRVETPAAGAYRVVVEGSEGAYLAANAVALQPGDNRPVSLALAQEPPAEPPAQPAPAPSGSQARPVEPEKKWVKWVIVGAIVVGGAAVVSAVTDEEEASPF